METDVSSIFVDDDIISDIKFRLIGGVYVFNFTDMEKNR